MIFKLWHFAILSIISAGLLTACGGGSGGSTTEGITVDFNAAHYQTAATGERLTLTGDSRRFTNTEGVQITFNTAYLTIWSVRLENDCSAVSFTAWLESFGNLLFPAVQAHTDTTPTQLGVPNVLNLLTDDLTELPLGDIAPPPATYCGLTVELLKADDDAVGLPDDVDMVNRLVYLEGTYLPIGATQPLAFRIDIAKAALPRQVLLPVPLTLSDTQRNARIVLGIEYDRWFNGIDFNQLQSDTQLDLLLNNITQAVVVFR